MSNPFALTLAEDDERQPVAANDNPFAITLRESQSMDGADAVRVALGTTPDRRAQARRLGERVGVPGDVLERNPDEMVRLGMQARLDDARQRNAALGDWLAGGNLASAHDDIEELGYFADQWQRFKQRKVFDSERSFLGGIVGDWFGTSVAGTGRLTGSTGRKIGAAGRELQRDTYGDEGNEEDVVGSTFGILAEGAGDSIIPAFGDVLQSAGDLIQSWGDWLKPDAKRQTFVDQVASGLGQVGGQVATPQLSVPAMFAQGAEIAGERAEAAGASQEQTDAAAVQGAVVTGLSERLFGVVGKFGLDKIPGVRQLVERFGPGVRGRLAAGATGVLDEGGQEVIEGIGQDIVATQYDPNAKIGQGVVQDFSVAGTVGLLTRAALHISPRVRRIEGSTEGADFLEGLQQAAAATKTGKRDPQALAGLVRQLQQQGGPAHAYIGAEDFVALFQDGLDASSAAADLTGHAEALNEALAANGDLQIPIDRFVTLLAGDKGAAAVKVARLDPEHLPVWQVRQLDLEKEAEALREEVRALFEADTSALPVDQQVYGELVATGRYKPADAEMMAKLLPRFYQTIATATGRTVAEVQAEYPVRTISDTLGDQLRRRDPNAETLAMTPILDAIRSNKIPTQRDVYGPSLLDFLVSQGGVQDFRGELQTMEAGRARPGLVNIAGLTLDDALAAAREAGYFPASDPNAPESLDIGDLLDAIREEISGKPRHLTRPVDVSAADLRATALQWQEVLPELLDDTETMDDLLRLSNQQILARARERMAGGFDQTVFHGTPHTVDRFSLQKIGTGEGAQAFGWGLYFAGRREIAEHYKNALAPPVTVDGVPLLGPNGGRPKAPVSGDAYVDSLLIKSNGNIDSAIAGVTNRQVIAQLEALRGRVEAPNGRLYSVDVPEDSDLLDWDKPISEQPEDVFWKIRDDLATSFDHMVGNGEHSEKWGELADLLRNSDDLTGSELYQFIAKTREGRAVPDGVFGHGLGGGEGARFASEMFQSVGIPGLRFLDGGSRASGEGSHNYVIWDENAISEPQALYQSATDQTDTPEFKRWFGDSKVVDESGKPLVVYHGTRADISEFDNSRANGLRQGSEGFYFTKYQDDASGYAGTGPTKGANVMPVYVRIENPYRTDGRDSEHTILSADRLAELEDEGFDGWIVADGEEVIAFRPEQIKSAIGNRGTFDPNDPNILHQPADGGRDSKPRGKIQFPRLGVGQGDTIIRISETADQSTFLHEMGHFFLEVLAAETTKADAAPALKKHLDTFLDWFGVTADEWRGMSLEQKRPYHEQFARGFERYLGEGKAPSHGLRGAFRSFKRWIVAVYRDLTRLNVELSDDVRNAFDRLLASEDEIEAARKEQGFEPALTVDDAKRLGLSEAFVNRYAQTLEKAKESLTAKVLNAKLREARRWYREQVKAERERVKAEAEAMPVYRTIKALRGEARLDKAALVRLVGEASLPRFRGLYAVEGGANPDLVADSQGWPSTQAMLEAVMNAPPLREYVAGEASARVRERHGDPMTDGTIGDEAQRALHNSRMMGALQAELDALGQLSQQAPPKPGALKLAAQHIVAQRTARELAPHQYLVAERKAANAAIKAAAQGDYGAAFLAKRQQALNAALYAEARRVQARIDRFGKHARNLAKGPAQKRLAAAGGDYLAHLNGLLAAYDFRALSGKERRRRQNLRAWVESLQDEGEITAVTPELLARVEAERVVNWRDVPVSEVLALDEAVRNLEHLASLKNRLLAGARRATKEQAIDELQRRADASIPDNLPDVVSDRDKTLGQRAADTGRGVIDAITRPETLIEFLDGGTSGPWHDFLWAPQVTAENKKIGYMRTIGQGLKALHDALPAGFMANLQTAVTFKGVTMSRFTLLSAAMNLGNAGNRQRLRDGGISTVSGQRLRLTEADLGEMASLLTAPELRYVQGLWDVLDTLRPEIAALTQRMAAVPVDFVQALPMDVRTADGEQVTLRGGYWPLAYHFDRSAVGERQAEGDALKAMQQAGAARAVTAKGHTKARVEELSAPLQLDFGQVLSRSLDQVMTDLAYREAVRDTTMLLRDPRVKAAIIGKLGRGALDAINGGITFSVAGGADVAGMVARGWRQGADFVLANLSVSALAIRPDIALGNYTAALVQALPRTSKRSVLVGLRALYGNRAETTAAIRDLSPFMANRLGEFDHQYMQALRTADGKRGFRAAYFRMMMTLHRFADHEATQALWWGSYETARRNGTDQAEAVRLADKLIRQTQTATGRKDLSTFERDPAFAQSKQFMGPMFVQFARLAEAYRGRGVASQVGNRLSILLYAQCIGPAIFLLAAGRAPDDDDDDGLGVGDWSRWLAMNTLLYPLQAMPLVRELQSSIEAAFTDRPVNPRGAPTAQAAANLVKAGKSLAENLKDEDADGLDYWDLTRDLSTVGGAVAGMPSSQINKTSKAVEAIVSDDRERGALEMSEMALYGKPVYSKPAE